MYKVMPKKVISDAAELRIFLIYLSKKAFIEEITSKTSELDKAGCTGKLKTSPINRSEFGQFA